MAVKVVSWFVFLFFIGAGAQAVALTRNTYLGNSGYNVICGMAEAPDHTLYVVGVTSSTNFPGTETGAQPDFGGGKFDMFVAHLSADLSTLLGSTYIGGSDKDAGYDIAYDTHNNMIYVLGTTFSTDFPDTGQGAQPAYAGDGDSVIIRLTPNLKHMRSTYLGGSGDDTADREAPKSGPKIAIAISPRNRIYVTGPTNSIDFPGTTGGAQPIYGGGSSDAYVAALTPDLSRIYQATYLGGSGSDTPFALAANQNDGVYVAGGTQSPNFPTTPGASRDTLNGPQDAFVTELSPSLQRIKRSTYFGGSGSDLAHAIYVDAGSQVVYVGGKTSSHRLPKTANGAQPVYGGGSYDAFVTDLDLRLSEVRITTYLGGSDADSIRPTAMALSPTNGALYVSGVTYSPDFPAVAGGAQASYPTDCDFVAFVTELTPGLTQIVQSTYLGGSHKAPSAQDNHTGTHALYINSVTGDAYTAAATPATDIPNTAGAYQPVFGGNIKDGLISAFNPLLKNPSPVAQDGTLDTTENTAASGTLVATDPDGNPLTYVIDTQPANGTVTLDDPSTGAYTYFPNNGYTGSDSFTFHANNGTLDSNEATISISVADQPPVAQDGTLDTTENTAASGTLVATDPDGDPLTYVIDTEPANGTVTLDDASTGAYTYTPNSGYVGADSFTFHASDGTLDSNEATISITVSAPDQPPIAQDGTLATTENTAASGTLVATDPDGDPLTYVIDTEPANGTVTLDDASTGAYTYTPNTDYVGADSFTFHASDGTLDSNEATISITVSAPDP